MLDCILGRSDIMISEAEKKNLKIGYKQTMKALINKCEKVYVAEDSEERIRQAVIKTANDNGSVINFVSTMQELGKLCGISRGASCAVIVNE